MKGITLWGIPCYSYFPVLQGTGDYVGFASSWQYLRPLGLGFKQGIPPDSRNMMKPIGSTETNALEF